MTAVCWQVTQARVGSGAVSGSAWATSDAGCASRELAGNLRLFLNPSSYIIDMRLNLDGIRIWLFRYLTKSRQAPSSPFREGVQPGEVFMYLIPCCEEGN